jgi:hypothetical protein
MMVEAWRVNLLSCSARSASGTEGSSAGHPTSGRCEASRATRCGAHGAEAQLIQGLLGLADQQVDPGEQLLDVGSEIRILSHGLQRDPTFSLTYRLRLSPRIRQREAEQGVRLSSSGASRTVFSDCGRAESA